MTHVILSSHGVKLTQVQAWWTDFALISKGNLKICSTMTLWRSTSTTVMHKPQGTSRKASHNPIFNILTYLQKADTGLFENSDTLLTPHLLFFHSISIPPFPFTALFPSGEVGFRAMSESLGWAKRPMLQRVHLLPSSMPLTMLYGAQSWVDSSSGDSVVQIRSPDHTKVMVSRDAKI